VFAQDPHVNEQFEVTAGELVPGYFVGFSPITFTPGVGFINPSPAGDVATIHEYQTFNINNVPIPTTVWLFGSALGLFGWVRRKRR
jgi:hypothetical protein